MDINTIQLVNKTYLAHSAKNVEDIEEAFVDYKE